MDVPNLSEMMDTSSDGVREWLDTQLAFAGVGAIVVVLGWIVLYVVWMAYEFGQWLMTNGWVVAALVTLWAIGKIVYVASKRWA